MITKEDGFDLHLKWDGPEPRRYAFTAIILFVSLIIIYGNSFHCIFHFDDYDNITENQNIKMETLSWENVKKTFCGRSYDQQSRITRPISYLSFALNHYISGPDVFGYHVTNFVIHYLAAVFLFLLLYRTLRLPVLSRRYEKAAYAVALLSAFIWATHPIQVSAVTYVVQRMASMAGMFYIMAMYFYVRGRTERRIRKRAAFFTLFGLTALAAFGSKENAAMLPVSLFFYDLIFIQGAYSENIRKNFRRILFPVLIVLVMGYLYADLSSFLEGYEKRPFNLGERLLTEPRVLFFYVTLLIYPTSSRLALLHDIEISGSFLSPWTTLPAILLIFALTASAIAYCRKIPIVSYCILFFFLNHLTEGSFIPLELIFEHRNYIPSMFFFTPIAILAVRVLDYFSYKKFIQWVMLFAMVFLLAAHGHTTFLRNSVFKDNLSLWTDNAKKAENLHRPHHNLGSALLSAGLDDEYLSEMQKALAGKVPRNNIKYMTHFNLGIYYFYQNEYDISVSHFSKSLEFRPNNPNAYGRLAMIMFFKNDLAIAEKHIRKAVKLNPDSSEHQNMLGWILLKKGDIGNAMRHGKKALMADSEDASPYWMLGEAYRLKGNLKTALAYFQTYFRRHPEHIPVTLALTELYSILDRQASLEQSVCLLFCLSKDRDIASLIREYDRTYNCLGDDRAKRITDAIQNTIIRQSACLEKGDEIGKQPGAVHEKLN
ncbi:MAG: hypothetical protein DRI57_01990 [Deltaproteobacteria bacterium]|nr:MAG: hypothetical protein DRI57_01990 [Deltaproteobacteria bacterium]